MDGDFEAVVLHRIWQKHHKFPHEVWALPKLQKAFVFASELVAVEAEVKRAKKNK